MSAPRAAAGRPVVAPPEGGRPAGAPLDVDAVRAEFPALHQLAHGRPLAYLDNAATTQKPRAVLDAIVGFYERDCSNVHRGVHVLSERATRSFEAARETVRRFIGAASEREVVFVRGTTEAVNLVANSFVRPRLGPGDEVLVTAMEHHSNIVPWQLACEATGARLVPSPIDDRGDILLDELESRMGERTKFVSIVHVSNALGTINPVEDVVAMARRRGIPVMLDGAQAVSHLPVDVHALGCDFYAFSGHKLYAPTGIGVLWGREEHLQAMPPWMGGGDMIASVSFERTLWNRLPFKFEAGTPNVSGAIGLAAAIDFVSALGLDAIASHEADLLGRATEALRALGGVRLVGEARQKAAVLSFVMDGIHPHDVGTIVDRQGVAIRTGHHCAEPLMRRFGVPATARASFGLYNTIAEVDALRDALREVRRIMG